MASDSNPKTAAFAQLVAEQHQQLRSFVRAVGVDEEWVDDLAQEVFLVAWREQDRFDHQQDVGKWLRGIARNLVRNELRKQKRHQRLLHEGLTQLLIKAEAQSVESWEQCHMPALRDCVEQLPPRSRKLVAGRYGDGWKAADLAHHFGMSAAAVRQALGRIRSQLKNCIDHRTATEAS